MLDKFRPHTYRKDVPGIFTRFLLWTWYARHVFLAGHKPARTGNRYRRTMFTQGCKRARWQNGHAGKCGTLHDDTPVCENTRTGRTFRLVVLIRNMPAYNIGMQCSHLEFRQQANRFHKGAHCGRNQYVRAVHQYCEETLPSCH